MLFVGQNKQTHMCGKNADFLNVTSGGIYNYRPALSLSRKKKLAPSKMGKQLFNNISKTQISKLEYYKRISSSGYSVLTLIAAADVVRETGVVALKVLHHNDYSCVRRTH